MKSLDEDPRGLRIAMTATATAYLLIIATHYLPPTIAARANPVVAGLAAGAVLVGVGFAWRCRRRSGARLALALLLGLVAGMIWRFLSR